MKQQQPQSIQTTYTYACTHMHRLIPIPMITYTCKQTYMLTYPIISNHNLITIKPTHAKVCTSYMIVYPQYKYQTPRCEVTRAPLPLEDLPPLPQVVSDPSHNQWLPMVLLILALAHSVVQVKTFNISSVLRVLSKVGETCNDWSYSVTETLNKRNVDSDKHVKHDSQTYSTNRKCYSTCILKCSTNLPSYQLFLQQEVLASGLCHFSHSYQPSLALQQNHPESCCLMISSIKSGQPLVIMYNMY